MPTRGVGPLGSPGCRTGSGVRERDDLLQSRSPTCPSPAHSCTMATPAWTPVLTPPPRSAPHGPPSPAQPLPGPSDFGLHRDSPPPPGTCHNLLQKPRGLRSRGWLAMVLWPPLHTLGGNSHIDPCSAFWLTSPCLKCCHAGGQEATPRPCSEDGSVQEQEQLWAAQTVPPRPPTMRAAPHLSQEGRAQAQPHLLFSGHSKVQVLAVWVFLPEVRISTNIAVAGPETDAKVPSEALVGGLWPLCWEELASGDTEGHEVHPGCMFLGL